MIFFNIFSRIYPSGCHGNQSNSASGLDKIHMFGRGLLNESLCKTLVIISAERQQ